MIRTPTVYTAQPVFIISEEKVMADLPTKLVVGTMCHCDDPDDCFDHWEFYVSADMATDGEHVRIGRRPNVAQMRAIAELVNSQ